MSNVTVLICNYNYGQWIQNAIESVLSSDYSKDKINICLIDDCSTDDSVSQMFKNFKGKDVYEYGDDSVHIGTIENINTYILPLIKNRGPSYARNFGIDRTLHCTDYYLILDADDEIKPNKISRMVEVMNIAPNMIGVVYADYETYNNEDGRTFVEYKESFTPQRLIQECIVHSGSLVNKEALLSVKDENGFYDCQMRVAEDYDLWVRLCEKWGIIHIPEILSRVRIHNNNSTNTVDKEIWNDCVKRIASKGVA